MKLTSTSKAHEDGVKILVYGASGAGKTTLIQTLPDPFIVSTESGLLSIVGNDFPVAEINSAEDLEKVYKHVLKIPNQSICIDSITDIAETILGSYHEEFVDGRQAYGKLNVIINKYIRLFRNLKEKNVYFTAKEGVTEINKILVKYPAMPGKTLTQDLPYYFDEVLNIESDRKGVRKLITESSSLRVAKDRSGKLDKTELPDLGKIINKIRGSK